jgi:Protein of unknown function (DUF2274)
MGKLKLGPLEDDKPVKISIELPAALHRDLLAYAEIPWPRKRARCRACQAGKHGNSPIGERATWCIRRSCVDDTD